MGPYLHNEMHVKDSSQYPEVQLNSKRYPDNSKVSCSDFTQTGYSCYSKLTKQAYQWRNHLYQMVHHLPL